MRKSLTLLCLYSWLAACTNAQEPEKAAITENFILANDTMIYLSNFIVNYYAKDTAFITKYKASQKIWMQYRDAQLAMKFPAYDKSEYGSIYSQCAGDYLAALTNQRNAILKVWKTGIPEGEVCRGSIPLPDQKRPN